MASTVAEGGIAIPRRTKGWLERHLGTDTYRMLRRLVRNPLSVTGGVIMVLFIFVALAAPVLAPPVRANVDPAMIPKDGSGDDPRAPGSIWGTENVPPRPFWYEAIIGRDNDQPIAVVVHPSNPVNDLTLEQLADIYADRYLFSLDPGPIAELDSGVVSAWLVEQFQGKGYALSQAAQVTVRQTSSDWVVGDGNTAYAVIRENRKLAIYTHRQLFGVAGEKDVGDVTKELNRRQLPSSLLARFQEAGQPLTAQAQVQVKKSSSYWLIVDGSAQYELLKEGQGLNAYTREFLFSTEAGIVDELDNGEVSARVLEQFRSQGYSLPAQVSAEVKEAGQGWAIADGDVRYHIVRKAKNLNVYIHRLTNWRQLGGPDLPIVPLFLRPGIGATYYYCQQAVAQVGQEGNQDQLAPEWAVRRLSPQEISTAVRQTPGAIGIYGLGSDKDEFTPQGEKVLAIARSAGQPAVLPSLATVRDGSYPIVRERWIHIMGTAPKQYDIWYGVVWGTRTAFLVGLVITLATALIGVTIGSISAFYGRAVDMVLMRVTDVFLSFPFLVAALTLSAILSPVIGKSLIPPMIALTAFGWMGYSRLIRSDILSIREREYVLAARVVGVPDSRIIFRHILPNAIFPTLVVASMDIGSYVLSFAGLSFLGVGVEEGYADWGQLLSFTRDWIVGMKTAPNPYIIVYPGLALLLFVLAWNLVGDALRDVLDPRMRGTRA